MKIHRAPKDAAIMERNEAGVKVAPEAPRKPVEKKPKAERPADKAQKVDVKEEA